mmetsp:Transcript_12242/g.22952  ORF Transcript_12242/g.22952 Transcript_12242/m.22952 type:complete len:160 (-) Transcript_12242:11-490(-)
MVRKKNKKKTKNAAAAASPTPQTSKPSLRFMVGDYVEFQRDGCIGWHGGTVEELWYRDNKWPDSHPSCPYLVEQKSQLPECLKTKSAKVCITSDDDLHIRVVHHSKCPKPVVVENTVSPPEPEDPLWFLYHPNVPDDQDEHVVFRLHDALAEFSPDKKK